MALSLRSYAKHRGVSLEAVRKALKSGRITAGPDGKLDPERTDADWKANTRNRIDRPPAIQSRAERAQPDVDFGGYAKAQAMHEFYRAQLAKIEYERRRGKLLDAEQVRDAISRMISLARNKLVTTGEELAPRLAVEGDPTRCTDMVNERIFAALSELAEWPAGEARRKHAR